MGKERVEAAGRGRGQGVVKKQPPGRKGGGKRGFYLAIAGILVVAIGTLTYLSARPSGAVTQLDPNITPVPNQGHVIGSDSAPVEIIEFADFECPACGQFATVTEPDVRTRIVNAGLARFRFMHFPLSMHPNTWPAHNASWCAGEQNRFWEMHDAIFQNQDRWSGTSTNRPERVLNELARGAGVNMDQFEGCMSSRKYYPQIQANVDEGNRLGVGSTPTFIIGGRMIANRLPYDELKRYVDEAVAAARSGTAQKGSATR